MVEATFFTALLTPTSLFLLLNLVILTILLSSAFTHNLRHQHHHRDPPPEPPLLARSSSLLSRVVSFNFSHSHPHYEPEPPTQPDPDHTAPLPRTPSLLSRVSSFRISGLNRAAQPDQDPPMTVTGNPAHEGKVECSDDGVDGKRAPSLLTRVASFDFTGFNRSPRPDPVKPASPVQQEPAGGRRRNEEAGESRARKQKKEKKKGGGTGVKARETASFRGEGEEEVDAKADDFINRFKQQLKMQRLDSLLRYRNSADQ